MQQRHYNSYLYISRCALVCKRWSSLTKDDSLWRRVDLGLKSVRPGVIGQVNLDHMTSFYWTCTLYNVHRKCLECALISPSTLSK